MNENLKMARKFKNRSLIIFFTFIILSVILAITFSYLFNNYWLLFGIPFALYLPKIKKLFLFSTLAIIVYWFVKGFNFSNEFTFFWISALFGAIFQLLVKTYDELAHKIIQNESSEISTTIKNSIEMFNKN